MSECASLAEPISSTGSVWIICRSKTYSNKPYYFNTLTGESLWNLSKAEIEKARRTPKDHTKSFFSTESYPEPEGSPELHLPKTMKPNNNKRRPQVYNKQIINNKFTRTSNYTPMNTMPCMGIAVPSFNPLIWNVPPQPVVFGPSSQADYLAGPNINTQLPVSETSVPLSKRFSGYTESQNVQSTLCMNTQYKSRFTNLPSTDTSMNSVKQFDVTDLREKLSTRRSFRNFESHQNKVEDTYVPSICHNEEILLNMKDEDWLAKNLQSNPYSIDTSMLKELVNVEDDTEFLYIITDTTILLSNTNFFRVLLNDDKQCNLVLPQAVCDEIEKMSESNQHPEAKQALAFISQQIILHQAIIDQKTLHSNGICVQDEILACCSRISEQGYPVILITDNNEMLLLKETVPYQILTTREFKTRACRPTENVKKYLPLNDIEPNIKITIPNKLNEDPSKYQTKYMITDDESEPHATQTVVSLKNYTNDTDLLVSSEQEDKTFSDNPKNTITTDKQCTSMPRKLKINKQTSSNNWTSTSSNSKNFKWRRKSTTNENNEQNQIESISSIIKTNVHNADNVNASDSSHDNSQEEDDIIFIKTEVLSPKHNLSKEEKNVMFEITTEHMEDNLKLKCDEWVSRFIQIMEEVLTQVLHREPKYVCDAMPPPWTLYEATECTRKKFHTDSDIVDAANKLRNILFDIGGSRGKVKLNISPIQYMEMYSYGVYLTDALQSVISDCEDLQVAAESLYKLLSDIQDTNADVNNQDSLCNITNEEIEKTIDEGPANKSPEKNNIGTNNVKVFQLKDIPNIIIRKNTQQNTIDTIERSPAKSKSSTISNEFSSPSKYFLRSNRKCEPQKEQTTHTSKWDFFNKLDLTRTSSLDNLEPISSQEIEGYYDKESGICYQEPYQDNLRPSADSPALMPNQGLCTENQLPKNLRDTKKNNSFYNSEHTVQISEKDSTLNNSAEEEKQPKIVRNFVRCIDFEEKLKKNCNMTHDVNFSYDQDFDIPPGSDFYNEFEYDDYEYGASQIYYNSFEFDDGFEYDEDDKQIFDEEVNDMNCFINEVVTETKAVFTLVKAFCEKCYDILNSSITFDKSDTLQEAENVSKSLDDICDTLNSILNRETSAAKDLIKTVAINPELNCIEMSDDEANKYRKVISKSIEQGKILKEAITITINVLKSKT